MRPCSEDEITIEKLLNVVHSQTDPIRIEVVMHDAWRTCEEAKHMKDFVLTRCYSRGNYNGQQERERLLKYYKDVPVWNLAVWVESTSMLGGYIGGRALRMGISARCHYKDIREGYLAEKADLRRAKQREYRKRKKEGEQDED